MCVTRHAQITWNNKFAISLQHKKEVSDAVDFLHADKHESLLKIDIKIFFMGLIKYSQSSQNSEFAMSLQYL